MNLPVLAGTLSTVLFAVGMVPMLVQAARDAEVTTAAGQGLVQH